MRERESEFEILGAEAIPAGFYDIDCVARTSLEYAPIDQSSRQQFMPVGLVAIVAQWLERMVTR